MDNQKPLGLQVLTYQVKLKKNYMKIFHLMPAADQTFVFVGMYALGKEVFVHCDKEGKVLFEYKFTKSVDSLGMVESNKAIVLETQHNQITVFNLSNHEIVGLPFQFLYVEPQAQLITFSESKYVCVVETGRYNDNRFKLTYFSGHLNAESKPIAVYESESSWTYEHAVRKGDEQSLVIWFKQRHDQQFQIKQFHLSGLNPTFNHFIAPNNIGQPYGKEKLQVALETIWKASQHKILMFCHTEKSNLGLENTQKNNNNNFIWDTSTNQIRQTQFYFGDSYNDFLIDSFSIGKYSVFHTFSFLNGNPEPSPVFYVDHQEERIISNLQRKWECSYRTKFTFPAYDASLYVESQYQNANVDRFVVKIIRIVEKLQMM